VEELTRRNTKGAAAPRDLCTGVVANAG